MVLWGDLARKDVLPVTWVEPSVLFSYPSSLLSFVEDIRTFNPFKAAVSRPGPPELPPPGPPGFLSYQSDRGGRMEIPAGLQGLGLDSRALKFKKKKKKEVIF